MWLIKPVVVCFSTKMSLCPPPHKPPCWLEKAADSWSKILPFPLAENLSGLVSCQSSQIPVMKLKQTSGTWCLVAIGSWCGLHSFSMESQCSSATGGFLLWTVRIQHKRCFQSHLCHLPCRWPSPCGHNFPHVQAGALLAIPFWTHDQTRPVLTAHLAAGESLASGQQWLVASLGTLLLCCRMLLQVK